MEGPRQTPMPQESTLGHRPIPVDQTVGHGPTPVEQVSTVGHGPTPVDQVSTVGHGPTPVDQVSTVGHGPTPVEQLPTVGHGPTPVDQVSTVGHGPTPVEQVSTVGHGPTPVEQVSTVGHGPTPVDQVSTVGHGPTPVEQLPTVGHGPTPVDQVSTVGHGPTPVEQVSTVGHGPTPVDQVSTVGHGPTPVEQVSTVGHGPTPVEQVSTVGHGPTPVDQVSTVGHGPTPVEQVSTVGHGPTPVDQVSTVGHGPTPVEQVSTVGHGPTPVDQVSTVGHGPTPVEQVSTVGHGPTPVEQVSTVGHGPTPVEQVSTVGHGPTPVDQVSTVGHGPTPVEQVSTVGHGPTPVEQVSTVGHGPTPVDQVSTVGHGPTPVDQVSTVGHISTPVDQEPMVGHRLTRSMTQVPMVGHRPIPIPQVPTVGRRLTRSMTQVTLGHKPIPVDQEPIGHTPITPEPTLRHRPIPMTQEPTVGNRPTPTTPESKEQGCALAERLGLSNYYSNKLHLQDALCITTEHLDRSVGRLELTDSEKLPFLVLHKIMSYDSLCRSALMQVKPSLSSSFSFPSSSSSLSSSSSEEDISDLTCTTTGINPVDCILALILCSDDFLRQDIFSRLAKCQLSVPLVIPDPFTKQLTIPLWAMRSIIKEWKFASDGDGVAKEQTFPMVSKEMHIVSFVRFSKQKYSKSGILNKVIGTETSYCDHFLHFQCRGGEHDLVLGDGMVDMCWYLPGGKPGDKFPDPVIFLNLHGDARDHPQQIKFLSKISTMCVALISKKDVKEDDSGRTLKVLEELSLCLGGFIMLTKDYSSGSIKKMMKKMSYSCLLALTDHIPSTAKGIVDQITKNLGTMKPVRSIEYAVKQQGKNEFVVDEEDGLVKEGLCHAEKVEKKITSKAAERMQGTTIWKEWASKNREMHRQKQDGQTLQHTVAGIQKEMKLIRSKQFGQIKRQSALMKCFVNLLLQLQGRSNTFLRNYFLQSLKLKLNKRSMERISKLGHDYQSVKNKLQTAGRRNETLIKKLKELEKNIIDLSFGLEHFLREVGQMYEALPESYQGDLLQLPTAAAELLIDGWPIEVMDGDAAHVPLTWVSAVLQEAAKILNDPKVFVLSVVGLQSTGKSTMLNTVFGLQFNVSAGRCTRGAFMQLLPLDEELTRETRCSYVLVVDTEGLRAPTSDPSVIHEHDNMLATFVIGLADMTFINIMGETPGDMHDILQTSVHAFVRMKLATQKFSPSCQFIHQNTGENVKKEVGDSKITAKLDECTLLAAELEQCGGEYKQFKDVIQFDGHTDIHHFPGLLKGGPPMAPIAEDYSSAAQELKRHFIEYLREKAIYSTGCGLSFSLLHTKINDLWFSLLEEKFVFSFKNTMEVVAYKTLETEWSKSWRWPFCEKMLTWEKNAENKITAADSVQSVSDVVKEKRGELVSLVDETKSKIQHKMKMFFDKKQNEQLQPWRPTFYQRLDILSSDLKEHAELHVVKIGDSRKPIFDYGKDQEKCKKIVRQGVSNHIERIKSSGVHLGPQPETVLKAEFDEIWREQMRDIPSTTGKIGNIEAEVEAKLLEFKRDYHDQMRRLLLDKTLTNYGQNLNMNVQEKEHFKFVGMVKQYIYGALPTDHQTVKDITGKIFDVARKHLAKKRAEKHNFHPGLTVDLLHLVDGMIDEESRKIEDTITFTSKYRIDIFFTVCAYAVPVFQEMADSFKERTDPRVYLERNQKKILLRQFIDQCRQVEAEQAIANALCASLEEPIKAQIRRNNMGVIMVRKLKASESHWFTDKTALKAKILSDIRNEDNFEGYMEFVCNVKKCFEKRIKAYVIEFSARRESSSRTRLQQAANEEVSRLIELVKSKVDDVQKTNVRGWLSVFCADDTLKEELGINLRVSDLMEGYSSRRKLNLDSFSERVRNGLQDLMQNLHQTFENIECKTEMENWRDKPHEILKDLIGCTEQCPFCGEQCDIGNEHGSETKHRTGMHRPSNLASWRRVDTQVMVVDFCPALVSSSATFQCKKTDDQPHPYKDYQAIYPDWTIPGDVTSQDSKYWMWFVAKYNNEIATYYHAKPPSVPTEWLNVTKEELKKHLEGVYHL